MGRPNELKDLGTRFPEFTNSTHTDFAEMIIVASSYHSRTTTSGPSAGSEWALFVSPDASIISSTVLILGARSNLKIRSSGFHQPTVHRMQRGRVAARLLVGFHDAVYCASARTPGTRDRVAPASSLPTESVERFSGFSLANVGNQSAEPHYRFFGLGESDSCRRTQL